MKKGIIILVIALIAGLGGFWAMRSFRMADQRSATLLDATPELAWLRTELKLTDLQFAKVSELHMAYRPKCELMCHRIATAHEKLEAAARAGDSLSPELQQAIADHARIHGECQKAMMEHIYRTAEELDSKQAARYLESMLPYALDFSNSEPGKVKAR